MVYRNLVKNYAYDQQSEGVRDWYADQILQRHPKQQRITAQFIERFEANTANTRYWGNQEHVFHVAVRLHRRGALQAQRIIDRFRSINDPAKGDQTGQAALLRLGRKGQLAYAKHMGAILRLHPDHTPSDILPYYRAGKLRKHICQLLALPQYDHTDYRRYLAYLKDYREPDFGNRPPRFTTYESYLDVIYRERYVGRSTSFFKSLRPEALRDLRERIHATGVTQDTLVGLLAPFQVRPYPGNPLELLPLLTAADRKIVGLIADILAPHRADRIRTTALLHLHAGSYPREMMQMIGVNLQAGDDEMLVSVMQQAGDQHTLHGYGYAILANCDHVPPQRLVQSLEFLYYSSRCGICREDIVRHLIAAGGGKPEFYRQLRFDAYRSTRKLARHP